MKNDKSYVAYVNDQIADAGNITCKAMFGGHAVYCNDKVVALICDNQFYVKPTGKGRLFIDDVLEGAPYPGAKLHFLIEEKVDDREWITQLIKITYDELPAPKLKKKRIVPFKE
jgi:TfoX/Sxy family transcriptional regulator of competence genes